MFEERTLTDYLAAVRREHAPNAHVFDSDSDFETLPQVALDELATWADELQPHAYDPDWLTEDSPALLQRLASGDFVVGMPGDGSVTWTTQTVPPAAIVKPRVEGAPEDFVDFLIAEALVEIGLGFPEHFLGFFEDRYTDFAAATPFDPNSTYQLAAAVYEAYKGRHTREIFEGWADENGQNSTQPRLHDAWIDAGERLEPRLDGLSREVARGETDFPDAAELACSAVKHGVEVPAPFGALDTLAYEEHGADFAVKWTQKLFD